jgi:hypothetical protein
MADADIFEVGSILRPNVSGIELETEEIKLLLR